MIAINLCNMFIRRQFCCRHFHTLPVTIFCCKNVQIYKLKIVFKTSAMPTKMSNWFYAGDAGLYFKINIKIFFIFLWLFFCIFLTFPPILSILNNLFYLFILLPTISIPILIKFRARSRNSVVDVMVRREKRERGGSEWKGHATGRGTVEFAACGLLAAEGSGRVKYCVGSVVTHSGNSADWWITLRRANELSAPYYTAKPPFALTSLTLPTVFRRNESLCSP